jgi:hypothetical protein
MWNPARQALTDLASDFEVGIVGTCMRSWAGEEPCRHWVEAELGYVDYIHFTQLGYELQADLLYTALMKAYHEYR